MKPRNLSTLAVGGILAASLLGCGGSATSSSSGAAGSPAAAIKNFAFAPSNLTVSVGTTLTWTNTDPSTHTVTSDDKAFDSGNLATNATFSHTFATAGTYSYHCSIHEYMRGSITVTS